MEISFLNDLSTWEQLARPWNDLLARSATDIPFLRFEFLRAWWTTLGGGEWPDGELWVAVGREQDGGLAAAAPFFRTSARPGALLLIGTVEIADYLDIVAPAPSVEPFAHALLDALRRTGPPGIDTVDLWNVLETSPGGQGFVRAAAAAGWSVQRERLKPCPQIALAGGWDAYLQQLEKKQRHELRRKMRRVEQTPGRFVRPRRPALTPAVEASGLMKFDTAKSQLLTPSMHAMFLLLRETGAGGWLRLELLTVDAAGSRGLLFDYLDRLLVYNPDGSGVPRPFPRMGTSGASHPVGGGRREGRRRFHARGRGVQAPPRRRGSLHREADAETAMTSALPVVQGPWPLTPSPLPLPRKSQGVG
jgi:hypothetical protein